MIDHEQYRQFAQYMAGAREPKLSEALQHVMNGTGGSADPNAITVWWNHYHILKAERVKWAQAFGLGAQP